jgi:Carboxypeptidase regulatory-like domain/Putative zinc-finger
MDHRQRAIEHPDENLLTAFAERTLARGERERVLAHLSNCSDCRDAVFLAQQAAPEPELQAGLRLSQLEPHPSRWRWAIVSVAGFLSAILIVLTVLLYRHPGNSAKTSSAQMAASERNPARAPTANAPSAPSSQTPAASNASGVLRSQVATARELTLHSRSSSASASPEAAPPNPVAAASATAPAASLAMSRGQVGVEIAGSVIDPSGAAIPGAKVLLRLPDATTRQAVTDLNGRFEIGAVPPGKYVAEFNAAGFQTATRDVDVQAQDRAALFETLAPGSASETVSVSAAAAQLQTENAQVQGTVNGKEVDPLLLSGRNVIQLSPGISNQPAQALPGVGAGMGSGVGGGVAPSVATLSIKNGSPQSCVGATCKARALPSRAQAVSVAFDASTALIVDANGNMFSTKDMGEHWIGTKPQWQGKVVTVRLASSASGSVKQSIGGPVASGPISGTFVPPSIFALTNDRGQVWLSSDEGQTWHLK